MLSALKAGYTKFAVGLIKAGLDVNYKDKVRAGLVSNATHSTSVPLSHCVCVEWHHPVGLLC